ncbi:MAG: hypothetical protein WDO19_03250 [Bacteroidota bacterium]
MKGDAIGKEWSFGQKKDTKYDSLVLIYLGDVTTDNGRVFKIMTSRWYWGLSPRGKPVESLSSIKRNQYLGDYYLTMTHDIPDEIQDNSLIFANKTEK